MRKRVVIAYTNNTLSATRITEYYRAQIVQSVVSLTSSLVVKMLTVLGSTIPNSKVFLLKKCE